MTLTWRAATWPKLGNSAEQNEDACALTPQTGGLLLALADGASEAVYSRAWARALVAAATSAWLDSDDETLGQRLAQTRRGFAPVAPGQTLPWYVQNKLQTQGSQAALLIVALAPTGRPGHYGLRAAAVGDCLLLVLRADGSAESFPILKAADFGRHPALIGTRPQPPPRWARWEASLGPGDVLVAVSDAVGKWALECVEAGGAVGLTAALGGRPGVPPSQRGEAHSPAAAAPSEAGEKAADAEPQPGGLLDRLWGWVDRFRPADEDDPGPDETLAPALELPTEPMPAPLPEADPELLALLNTAHAPGRTPRLQEDDWTVIVVTAG